RIPGAGAPRRPPEGVPRAPAAQPADAQPRPLSDRRVRLRLLATTDLHGQLLSYDYFANRPQYGQGLAQIATLIAAARAEVPGSILLDNGDFLQGSALTEPAAQSAGRRRPNPAIVAFNTLGYDAVALGNHEFNFGLDRLHEAVAQARFPVLAANAVLVPGPTPLADRLLFAPYALVRRSLTDRDGQRHAVTVGILGLTPPQILDWDRRHLEGRLQMRGMIEAARAWVPEIRRAGADLVVCLAHTGMFPTTPPQGDEVCAADLAALPGIDAVIAGHSHLVWPPDPLPGEPALAPELALVAGKPVVQPGHSGSHLGIIDLWLTPGARGWEVAASRTCAASTSEIVAGLPREVIRAAATPLRRELAPDHRAVLGRMRRSQGETPVALHSYFATLAPSAATQVLADAKIDHVRRALAGRPEAALPILASVTPFRIGGRGGPLNYTDIAPGPMTLRNVLDLYPFPNTLLAQEVTGAAIADRLEIAARIYATLRPGETDQPLIHPDRAMTLSEQIPGLSYRIDLSRREGRIVDLRFGGLPLAPGARLVLVTNSFRAATFPVPGARLLLDEDTPSNAVLAAWLRRGGRPRAPLAPRWSFVPMPGTGAYYDTGPGALRHLAEIAQFAPVFAGVTPQGFHRFRLRL
ncbi:MAG: 5'-nucleotidase C-terminal domain-containing protein, partial [Rhodobacteraceae bacterium]|nr:5'-nucleotidase C-terminal domain-containing protein [Paracoccaceae bacterium]